MSLVSPDGDNGFPGTVRATVRYTLTADNAIDISYEATTDKKTVINMTNHSYFNLNGNPPRNMARTKCFTSTPTAIRLWTLLICLLAKC